MTAYARFTKAELIQLVEDLKESKTRAVAEERKVWMNRCLKLQDEALAARNELIKLCEQVKNLPVRQTQRPLPLEGYEPLSSVLQELNIDRSTSDARPRAGLFFVFFPKFLSTHSTRSTHSTQFQTCTFFRAMCSTL